MFLVLPISLNFPNPWSTNNLSVVLITHLQAHTSFPASFAWRVSQWPWSGGNFNAKPHPLSGPMPMAAASNAPKQTSFRVSHTLRGILTVQSTSIYMCACKVSQREIQRNQCLVKWRQHCRLAIINYAHYSSLSVSGFKIDKINLSSFTMVGRSAVQTDGRWTGRLASCK